MLGGWAVRREARPLLSSDEAAARTAVAGGFATPVDRRAAQRAEEKNARPLAQGQRVD